jgi:hypothetical protein
MPAIIGEANDVPPAQGHVLGSPAHEFMSAGLELQNT